jgi:8-oxo-dGTP pyrophosphatase MutT (NUDIX family)
VSRRERPAARLLILDRENRILLFRFTPPGSAAFWATPGGAVDPGESYAQAGAREMFEETGIVADIGPEVAQRRVEFVTLEGEPVTADERYFFIRVDECAISSAGHTALEQRVMTAHRWWNLRDLPASSEIIFPEDLADLVDRVALGRGGAR